MPLPLAEQREKERCFLEQLLDTSKLESYSVPVPIKADLRKYQQVVVTTILFYNLMLCIWVVQIESLQPSDIHRH